MTHSMGLSVLIPNQLPLWGSDSEDGQDSKMGMTVPKGLDTELSTSSLYAWCGALMEANLERVARDQKGSSGKYGKGSKGLCHE
jgi:hypothetical protein